MEPRSHAASNVPSPCDSSSLSPPIPFTSTHTLFSTHCSIMFTIHTIPCVLVMVMWLHVRGENRLSGCFLLMYKCMCAGEDLWITWNETMVKNNSLVSLSAFQSKVSATPSPGLQYPLVCQGGQWYDAKGDQFKEATPDPVTTPEGLGQRNVSGRVELYCGTPPVFPHGVQCCTNTIITLCIGMYTDLTYAASVSLATLNHVNYALSVAATCK